MLVYVRFLKTITSVAQTVLNAGMSDYKNTPDGVTIVGSGSSGNCVIVDDIMIDCGVPFSHIKKYMYGIKTLLITHTHSDHINVGTLNKIETLFPSVTVCGNWDVANEHDVDLIANPGYDFYAGGTYFLPFECSHDVPCTGYVWNTEDHGRVIYATDTRHFKGAPDGLYDLFLIESNHDEVKLRMAQGQIKKYGYDAYGGGMRHASTQLCKAFYYSRRRCKESILIELHKSGRFY